ncbi:MAG: hypothetical protein LQ339_001200 [Xanthoria mediterranea]|nr:MAG: hypothetical protein LQ339_001200 [Xanthoria mediterranea]
MPSSEALTDDYVAQLLAKDAKDRTIKYSSYGLQAILPKRPTTNAPKPNTRFLKNIIKETDSHNAALRAKEIADARLRLRGINGNVPAKDLQRGHRGSGPRDQEDARSTKRRRLDEGRREDAHQTERRSHRHTDEDERHHKRRKRHYEDDSTDTEAERSSRHRRHHRRRHDRSTSPRSDRAQPRRSRHRRPSPSRSILSTSSRSRSPGSRKHPHHHHRSHHQRRHSSPSSSHPPNTNNLSPPPSARPSSPASNSDPLSSLIGPLPPSQNQNPTTPHPPLRRGRGAHTLHSASAPMDTHFASTYDPTLDIQAAALDPAEEDDWDNALEALRDRAKWRAGGAERLRAAGFTDEEVRKWEKSGDGEGREADVRWSGPGEGREWDRGKVVGDDGVRVQVELGRLKGT